MIISVVVTLGKSYKLTGIEQVDPGDQLQPFIKNLVVQEIGEMTYPHRIDLEFPLSSQ